MTLQVATITNSIAALTVTGLTILDIDEIPASAIDRNLPICYPEPSDFITNFNPQKAALGEGASSEWDVEFDIKYSLLYGPSGGGRGMEQFAPTIALALAFEEAIMLNSPLTGAVLVRPAGFSVPSPIADPSGENSFFGVVITLHVLEFVG